MVISDTVTTINNRLAIQFLLKLLTHHHRLVTIYSWMEQLAARFPHLVSLKVSNPLLYFGPLDPSALWAEYMKLLVSLKVSNPLLYLGHWTQVHVGPSI